MLRFLLSAAAVMTIAAAGLAPVPVAAAAPECPADLSSWRATLSAQWLDCRRLADLTTTSNAYTDPGSLTGMGYPPPGSGTLNSHYTHPTSPPVPGLQIDGFWADGCNAFQPEPVLVAKNGAPFFPGCKPPTGSGTCVDGCHNDGSFVIRIPDSWNGRLMTAGTPGIRDQFASDFVFSDWAMEHGWAYVSQDKGNMGANFYRDGPDEAGCAPQPWCPAVAIQEWAGKMRQATTSARALLASIAPKHGLNGVTRSYAAGISNGGYQVRRALEMDRAPNKLYDGGVDWEGTLFTTRQNLFTYLPTAIKNGPAAIAGDPSAVQALVNVGFNPESQPLWPYHYNVYWGLTQKIYRLEIDPEYTGYTCSDTTGAGPSCVSPAAEVVPPTDPDASYSWPARETAVPALDGRINTIANTGDIQRPLITLHGDQDALLPIKTDSDVYAQMVVGAGHSKSFRYYTVRGGNHVDPQFDDHYGVDDYGNSLLRPILPCVWSALDALTLWVEGNTAPPAGHTIPRPNPATAEDLANVCSLS
jgi:hypothetical protein